MFIKLTRETRIISYVDNIETSEYQKENTYIDISKAYQLMPNGGGTTICINDERLFVFETPEQILKMIKENKDV